MGETASFRELIALLRAGDAGATAAASREVLEEFRRRLSEGDRAIAEQRDRGLSWEEIAARLGQHPDAVRTGFQRRAAKVARALGMR